MSIQRWKIRGSYIAGAYGNWKRRYSGWNTNPSLKQSEHISFITQHGRFWRSHITIQKKILINRPGGQRVVPITFGHYRWSLLLHRIRKRNRTRRLSLPHRSRTQSCLRDHNLNSHIQIWRSALNALAASRRYFRRVKLSADAATTVSSGSSQSALVTLNSLQL